LNISKTFYTADRKKWRTWLRKNHKQEKDIWLVYYKKSSGKPRIGYNESVEEALCYGWIDSTVKKIDDERFAQRFTPRNPASNLSESNKERIRKLVTQKKMTSAGLKAVARVFDLSKDKSEDFNIPSDILKILKSNTDVWKNFQKFPKWYKRIRIAFIESRRNRGEEVYQKSLNHFIKMTSQNKRYGIMK
jgi:uncharacterized protein YdeI (YjbR/CyaY-like superfamily)